MKKTLITYGISGSILILIASVLLVSGVNLSKDGAQFLAPVAAVIILVAFVLDSFGMLCILLMILPFSRGVLQIELGIITFNPYTLGIVAFFVISIAGIIFGKLRYKITAEDWLMASLSVMFLISTLYAKDLTDAGFLAFHAVFIPVITYFVIKVTIQKDDQYIQALIFFVVGIVLFAVSALYIFYQDPSRLKIFGQSSISAAGMFSVAIMIVLYLGWWQNWVGKLALLILLPALLITFARGYLVLVLISPVFYIIIRRGKAFHLISAMLLISLVGTLMLAAVSELPELLKGQGRSKDEQTAERMTDVTMWVSALYGRGMHYKEGLKEFRKSPIIGNGFHQGSDKKGVRAVVWHNFHVEWLEYGGIFAYLLYISLFLSHYYKNAKQAVDDKYSAINLTIIFVLLTNGLTNSFTAGITPYLGFIFMAMNHVRSMVIKSG